MSWLAPVAGGLLVLSVLREVFHTLVHPAGQGGLTMQVFRAVWALSGRLGSRARTLAGPLGMVLVITLWAALFIVGWALVYWPGLPGSFVFTSALEPGQQDGFVDALYLSWVTQATLGYGDIAPRDDLLRMAAPLQATIGFGLLTAAVTWTLSTYPALQRQRTTAALAHAMREADARPESTGEDGGAGAAGRRLERLTDALTTCRVDFAQYPSTFYFEPPDDSLSLPAALPYVARLACAERHGGAHRPAAELGAALDALAATLGERLLDMPGAATDDVIAAWRRHHRLRPTYAAAT